MMSMWVRWGWVPCTMIRGISRRPSFRPLSRAPRTANAEYSTPTQRYLQHNKSFWVIIKIKFNNTCTIMTSKRIWRVAKATHLNTKSTYRTSTKCWTTSITDRAANHHQTRNRTCMARRWTRTRPARSTIRMRRDQTPCSLAQELVLCKACSTYRMPLLRIRT